MILDTHLLHMQTCLTLAQKGQAHVSPNPLVGAVITNHGEIIGKGFHSAFGAAHAEIEAIESVADRNLLAGATLYVNLEPCCHHGKTPPCVGRIIKEGIKRVVFACYDPAPSVHGRGQHQLEAAGIEIVRGILAEQAISLNRRFFVLQLFKRPYVILKLAKSSDGFIAPASKTRTQISNSVSQLRSHLLRAAEDAILVGTTTAINDDPELNVRLTTGRNPLRVVIDKDLRIPKTHKLFNSSARTIVVNAIKDQKRDQTEWKRFDFTKSLLPQILDYLKIVGVGSLIVEGGAVTLQHFIDQNLWDEAQIFNSPLKLYNGVLAPRVDGQSVTQEALDNDRLTTIYSAELCKLLKEQQELNQVK